MYVISTSCHIHMYVIIIVSLVFAHTLSCCFCIHSFIGVLHKIQQQRGKELFKIQQQVRAQETTREEEEREKREREGERYTHTQRERV